MLLIGLVGLAGVLLSAGLTLPGGMGPVVANLPLIGGFAVLTSALGPSLLAIVGDRAREGMKGSAMGLYSVMLSLGSAAGTVTAGAAHVAGGLAGIFEAAGAIFFSACAISFVLWRRAGSPSHPSGSSRSGVPPDERPQAG